MKSAARALIQGMDLFDNVADPELDNILAQARPRRILRGSSVFTQGASALHFFLLVEGQLKVVQASREGEQIIAHWVAPGQLFGFVIALGRHDYVGTALAVMDSTVLAWPMKAWDGLAQRHPVVAAKALRILGGHLQDAFARLGDVSAARVEQRIARALLRIMRQSGRRTEGGVQIEFPVTRRDIAELSSTTLYSVSRTLSAWEQAGVLSGGRRRRIVVLDPHALVRIAGNE